MTVKLNDPTAIGVPVSAPEDASVSPGGNDPAVTPNEYGAVPFDAVIVAVYAVPLTPDGNVDGASSIAATVSDAPLVVACPQTLLNTARKSEPSSAAAAVKLSVVLVAPTMSL